MRGMGAQNTSLERTQSLKLGKYTHLCVWGYRKNCLLALARAEEMHGRPVFVHEIYYELPQVSLMPSLRPYLCWQACLDLYQNDEILADKLCDQFSLNPKL